MSALRRYLRLSLAEGVHLRYELASPVSRALAVGLDGAAVSAMTALLYQVASPLIAVSADLGLPLLIVGYFAISTLYAVLMEWLDGGRTLGKRVLGLRVLDVEGRPLRFDQALLRNLLKVLDRAPFFYGVGGLVCALSPQGQRLGDLAAGTVVLRERRTPLPDWNAVAPERFNSLRGQRRLAARLRQHCSAAEAELGLELLQRRARLDDAARLRLFAALAERYRRHAGPLPEQLDGLSDEQWVRAVVDVLYQAQREEASAAPKKRAQHAPA